MKSVKLEHPRAFLRYKRVRIAGNVIDVKEYENMNHEMPIRRLDSENYIVLATGEILPYDKAQSRADGLWRLRTSMDNLRAILNANFTGGQSEIWSTLTYRENMKDSKRLTKDRQAFWQRLKYKYPDIPLEYVSIAEPQDRGAWHLHECWKRTDGQRLFIEQADLLILWGHGGVNVKRLDQSDNIGAYLTSYLSNMPITDDQGKIKSMQKGSRLSLYPPGMNFYRCSRGIVIPQWVDHLDKKTEAIIGNATPNYRQVIEITDDNQERVQTVLWQQYNMKRIKG